jgi:formylglycine-generating enzyme required for sulfatase activity
MGSTDAEITALTEEWGDYFKDEAPQHEVKIPAAFALGKYAISFDEWDFAQSDENWRAITGMDARRPEDEGWGRDRRPVINVSWRDAKAYVTWLSSRTGQPYRLLSEAEWEYTCRAGTTSTFSWGDGITPDQANYDCDHTFRGGPQGKYMEMTVPVDSFRPNPWGLVQMHGNVWEWCEDIWYENYREKPDALKGSGEAWLEARGPIVHGGRLKGGDPSVRIVRGGCWQNFPPLLSSAGRYGAEAEAGEFDIGFRVCRTLTS